MLSAYDYTVSKRRLIFIIISANAGQFCKKNYFKFPRKFITQVLAITKIFTARCYASAVLAMALCPYVCVLVCVSVTSRSSTKTAKHMITQTTLHDSLGTLVF